MSYNQNMGVLKKCCAVCACLAVIVCISCQMRVSGGKTPGESYARTRADMERLLGDSTLTEEGKFALVDQITTTLLAEKKYQDLILFVTTYVDKNPSDAYNAWWLLMAAYAYMQDNAVPVAEFYFDRIIHNYPDLIVKGQSIHLLCLKNLIQISTSPEIRIFYYSQLIARFSDRISLTELYMRLAMEYEKTGEWDKALKTYGLFVAQPDAVTIQISGIGDAYSHARKLIDFNNSEKDWTFESLEALETAVKRAIDTYNWRTLDRYKSKVNFFAMSWKQDYTDANSQDNTSMRDFMDGKRIRYSGKLDESSNPNEAYLRTTGWSQYISVWYLYFRKVNFPLDPEIHGRWEWAGIYYGDKI